MRRFLHACIVLLCSQGVAQQKPHYTQYFQNMAVLNPAVTGMENSIAFKAGFRNQWVGLDNAPETKFLTINMPLNIGSNTFSGFADYGVKEPSTRSERDDYVSSLSHHGIGLVVLNDKTGPINRTTFNLTYAYHLNVADYANLSVGVGGGINQINLDATRLQFENPSDPALKSNNLLKRVNPDLNAGIHFYTSSFYFGAVVQQVLNSTVSYNQGYTTAKDKRHYFLTSGYRIWLNEEFSLIPSAMLRFTPPVPKSFDANLKIAYKTDFWLAGTFRHNDSFAAMLGFNIANTVNLGYSYDYSTSRLNTISSGSHEIVLGLNF